MSYSKAEEDFLNFMKLEDGTPLVTAELMDYLIGKGFFKKPAAIKYHGNYTGGLFMHSFKVAKALVDMTNKLGLKWQNPRSPYIVGMFHDLCKMDDYVVNYDASDDKSECWSYWTYNNNKILKGHGDKSIMMLAQFMALTEEEIMCIRFHMGAYVTTDWDEYDRAIKKYETVLWTHTADMYASKVKGV
jgi:HD superfamily phosphohydrolase YqeK